MTAYQAAFKDECNYCSKWGHKEEDCWKLQNKNKRGRGKSSQNEVGGASMEIVLMHADHKEEEDESDLEYEDQEELDKRDRMIREKGPNYCH